MAKADKVLVLGLDGMEPLTTRRLVDEGKMPNTKKLIEMGAAKKSLELLGAMPTITPAQWTTLATGCYPGTHGITDFWNQDLVNLDTIIYGLDSRLCRSEQIWNVLAEAGKKTLVFHWPGSSWPPTSDSENLYVVDGTQPASVNYSIANIDIEKYIEASKDFKETKFFDHVASGNLGAAAADCVIDNLDLEEEEKEKKYDGVNEIKNKSELLLNRYKMKKIKNLDFHKTGGMGLDKVPFDKIESVISEPASWKIDIPAGAMEFSIFTSGGKLRRPCLILKNAEGIYDTVSVYKSKNDAQPLVTLKGDTIAVDVLDEVIENGKKVLATSYYKLLEVAPDGSKVRMWRSTAYKVDCDDRWSPKSIYKDIIENAGYVPPFTQIGGSNIEFSREILNPVWRLNTLWQARAINYMIEEKGIEAVFSQCHSIDHQAHQYWNYALQKEGCPPETEFQALIDKTYQDTDEYIGQFMHLIDKGWTIFIVSDHGEQIHYDRVAALGSASGVSLGVMKDLGWTVLKKDEQGNELPEIDWAKTKAVSIRTSYIWVNLKGRNPHGIVDPADKEAVEEEIIDSLYAYKDPATGKRIIALAMKNKDAILLGLDGPETGDIIIMNKEGCVTEHGRGLSTYSGYYGTSVAPIFIAAGKGIVNNPDLQRTVRQVDVAPTIAAMLKVRMPRHCEGAPVYQIISDDIAKDFIE